MIVKEVKCLFINDKKYTFKLDDCENTNTSLRTLANVMIAFPIYALCCIELRYGAYLISDY